MQQFIECLNGEIGFVCRLSYRWRDWFRMQLLLQRQAVHTRGPYRRL